MTSWHTIKVNRELKKNWAAKRHEREEKTQTALAKRKKVKYNLTDEEFELVKGNPVGLCPLCKRIKKLYIDHNHKTERFLGWVCGKCNAGLGMLGDDPEVVLRAYEYLVRS